jgi:hypothetical protein
MGVDRMFSRNERDEELRKLREELEELKEHLMKISGDSEAREPAFDEPVRVSIEAPDEAEGPPEEGETEEAEAVAPEARPSPRPRPWEEHEEEDRRYRRRDYDYKFDFGERLGDYISGFVEDVMEGVGEEIEQSLFVHPRGRFVVNRIRRPRRVTKADAKEAASVMSALGNEYRLKALDALSSGGLYASDFQEILGEISPSTLSSQRASSCRRGGGGGTSSRYPAASPSRWRTRSQGDPGKTLRPNRRPVMPPRRGHRADEARLGLGSVIRT